MKITKVLIALMVVGVILTAVGVKDALPLWKGDIDEVEGKSVSDYEVGDLTEGKIKYTLEIVAELETYETRFGVKTNSKITPYYLVQLEDGYAIVHGNNKDFIDKMKKNLDETTKYSYDSSKYPKPKPVKISTRAEEMPDELRKCLYDHFEKAGISNKGCDEMVANCVLQQIYFNNIKTTSIIGAVLIIVPLIVLIIIKLKKHSEFKSWQKKQLQEQL